MLPSLRNSCLRPRSLPSGCRSFASTTLRLSKIGRIPVVIPPEVTLTSVRPPKPKNPRDTPIGSLIVEGPLGTLSLRVPTYLSITTEPIPATFSTRATVSILNSKVRAQREMWGTTRSVLQSLVLGVTEGHSAILRLVGVGYRATMEKDDRQLSLKVGFSHPIELPVPEGVKCSVPMPTRILLEGVDKVKVKDFAAVIREWRKPEPYKGKGIFINDETIKLKVKKVK
ncbi:54S ribosomal protein L6 mitochondrial [Maublancomyces gigas]|uniref:54S ribosomal protein L6 mitochondrial n=1 Tax=Discina gigas TaxID=1032678 RepID=A0ABR3G6D5_9PEZI